MRLSSIRTAPSASLSYLRLGLLFLALLLLVGISFIGAILSIFKLLVLAPLRLLLR